MKSKGDVEEFLGRFKPKMRVWGIFFLGREKNLDTLKKLGMTPLEREEIIRDVEAEDFCEMINDTIGTLGEMWVFGKDYKGQELYIKISMGCPGSKTICISFHIAEHSMKYAFK